MIRRPPRPTLTYTLFPCSTLSRSGRAPPVGSGLHPDHVAMGAGIEPLPQPRRRPGGGVGARDSDGGKTDRPRLPVQRSEEHTSELQSLMRISYAVFCLKKKKKNNKKPPIIMTE